MTHDPEAGRKLHNLIRELGRDGLETESTDSVIKKFFPDTDMESRVLETIFEHAFRYFFLIGKEVYESLQDPSGNVSMMAFDETMNGVLRRKTRLESDQLRRLR